VDGQREVLKPDAQTVETEDHDFMTNEMIVVCLTVTPEDEAEFTDFYHHRYIPRLLAVFPEIASARRFVEHNVDGTLRYYAKQQLTFYELAQGVDATRCVAELKTRAGREAERSEWSAWAEHRLRGLESDCVYRRRYDHRRVPPSGDFFGGPFFMVSVETRPESKERFDRWYEEIYLRATSQISRSGPVADDTRASGVRPAASSPSIRPPTPRRSPARSSRCAHHIGWRRTHHGKTGIRASIRPSSKRTPPASARCSGTRIKLRGS
jgi:hypothetical protein